MESSKQQEMTVGDLMKLIEGFVDLLILASGYQSSGLLAHWDSSNLKNAFNWALFFENVFRHLLSSSNSDGFLKELDSSLSELRSNPVFPQGLTCISPGTLSRARTFLTKNVVHALPLRDEHLKALLMVSIELDLDDLKRLKGNESDNLDVFLEKLKLLSTSLAPATFDRSITDKVSSLQQSVEDMDMDNDTIDHTKLTIQELLERKSAASCLLSAEKSLLVLSNTVDFDNHNLSRENPQHATVSLEVDSTEIMKWNQWRCRNLSYFLDKRTIQLVSGASLIFSAPMTQWAQVLKQLASSSEASDTNLLEILEIMLLGCISSQWDCIVQHLTSVSCDSLTTLKHYLELCNSLQGRSRNFHEEMETVDSKVRDIHTYLTEFLSDSRLKQLWKLPPILLAAAIPSWSPLLRSYLSEIDSQLKGEQLTNRNYNCLNDNQGHIDCDLAERIWCLHIFHVRRFDEMQKTSTG